MGHGGYEGVELNWSVFKVSVSCLLPRVLLLAGQTDTRVGGRTGPESSQSRPHDDGPPDA